MLHLNIHFLLQLSTIQLTHKLFSSPSEWIPAMNKVKQIVAEANFSNRAFPVGTEYASWETDEVMIVHVYSTQNRFCSNFR